MHSDTMKLNQKPSNICDVDLLRDIAEHVAKGDTFDETLASAIDVVVRMFGCDVCVANVRDGKQLIPWVWKYSEDRSVEQDRRPVDDDCVRALSELQQPIAVSQDMGAALQGQIFQHLVNPSSRDHSMDPVYGKIRTARSTPGRTQAATCL